MLSDRSRKSVRKGPIIFWLTISLGLHVAVLAVPPVTDQTGERPHNVEVGLLPLPPQIAGTMAPGEPAATASSPPPQKATEQTWTGEKTPNNHEEPAREEKAKPSEEAIIAQKPLPAPVLVEVPHEAELTASVSPVPTAVIHSAAQKVPAEPSSLEAGDGTPKAPTVAGSQASGTAAANVPLIEALPRYDRNAPPHYPRLARQRGWEGEVLLRVVVTDTGRVRAVEIERSSGHALLDRSALTAVRRWRFHPSRLGAIPVEGEVRVPVRFELRES